MAKELTARLKKQGFDTERIANKLMQHEGQQEFEEFTNTHAKMKYQEHEILYNKWVKEERERRLDQKNAVQVNKATRLIEPSKFGHF